MRTLTQGDEAPGFSLPDPEGKTVQLADFRGRRLLIYFYPKAGTAGCTAQTAAVRDALARFDALGTAAVGISPDPVAVQKRFRDRIAPNFPLLSDADHAVAEAYGVWGEKSLYGRKYLGVTRSAFLIDAAGRILAAWPKISPADTVPKALAALQSP